MKPTLPIRLIKLGGSLLGWKGFPKAVERWLEMQSPCVNLFVVGGGKTADLVRDWDQNHQLSRQAAHRLAIDAMGFNTKLVEQLLLNTQVLESTQHIHRANCSSTPYLLSMPRWLSEVEAITAFSLPESWDCTSDSIAAFIATYLERCDELVLLKSTLPSEKMLTIFDAVEHELVDPHFPQFAAQAAQLKLVRCVNLRDETFPSVDLIRRES